MVFWTLLVVASGFSTFMVKYAVQNIEDDLNRVRRHTVAEQQEIRVLTAEWTYLNQPERLAELNKRFLGLAPIATKQLQQRVEDIPLRPAPPPPAMNPEVGPIPVSAPAPGEPSAGAPPAGAPPAGASTPAESSLSVSLPNSAPASTAPISITAEIAPPSASVAPQRVMAAAMQPTPRAAALTPAALTPAALRSTAGAPVHPQIVKAVAVSHPGSLDALIAQIAEAH
jgi:hypothetical protein